MILNVSAKYWILLSIFVVVISKVLEYFWNGVFVEKKQQSLFCSNSNFNLNFIVLPFSITICNFKSNDVPQKIILALPNGSLNCIFMYRMSEEK